MSSSSRAMTSRVSMRPPVLPGPEPPERARREKRVDQPVDRRLDRIDPGAAIPDRHLPERHRVANERGGPDELKHAKIVRARGQRTPGDIRRKESHCRTINKPEPQV